jgi:iron complex transport system substrate-binding protein
MKLSRKYAAVVLLTITAKLFAIGTEPFLTITDSRDREIKLQNEPLRVISLAPGITETIYALGAQDKLVGRTDYCDYPVEASDIEAIGSLYKPNIEKIITLNPDLIIASTHFQKEILTKLEELSLNVIIINENNTIESVYENIETVGLVLNRVKTAKNVTNSMKSRITNVVNTVKNSKRPNVYYVIGYGEHGDYTAGGDTFISNLLNLAGGNNIAEDSIGWSYSLEKIVEQNPDKLICSQYYNVKEGIKGATGYKDLPAVKSGNLFTIDNNLIDRQGPRVVEGLEALAKILHPDSF